MLDMALNATEFYRNESCGKCVPCRVGSSKLVEMLEGWTRGKKRALRSCSARRTRGHTAAYFHLRPWPSGAGSHCVRPETFSRGSGCTSVAAAMSCRRLRLRYKKLKIYRLYLGALMSANPLIELTIDGKKVSVPAGTTVFDAARINDIAIPTLCHQQNETPGRSLPRLCRGRGRACFHRLLHSTRGSRNGGEYGLRQSETRSADAGRTVDVRSSQRLAPGSGTPAIANSRRLRSTKACRPHATRRDTDRRGTDDSSISIAVDL